VRFQENVTNPLRHRNGKGGLSASHLLGREEKKPEVEVPLGKLNSLRSLGREPRRRR
jgi:hypothetical protein